MAVSVARGHTAAPLQPIPPVRTLTRLNTQPLSIDLNADLGEDPAAFERDLALATLLSSLNVACGGHAGDDDTMARLCALAADRGKALGAHPGYPDRANFGRLELQLSPVEIETTVAAQLHSLAAHARCAGTRLTHVKPHGA
ncbi:MAG: LamB/YcsF family protein, partial [Phycisphaerae bacterium]|nr:LamB/YcsF family protein [Phycisphaerae bacterium]